MKKVVLASGNAGKLREFGQMLQPWGWEVVPQSSLNVTETDEPFETFVENALRKARNASAQTGLPALSDDSGLCIPALLDAPGVFSARYALRAGKGEGDAANNRFLIESLRDCGDRAAYYYCVLVWVRHAHDPCPIIAEGRWKGAVVDSPLGDQGFGYDPHFLVANTGLTVAQMSSQQKNALSHRGQALRRLVQMIE